MIIEILIFKVVKSVYDQRIARRYNNCTSHFYS